MTMLKLKINVDNNTSNQRGANSVTVAPWHTISQPRMLVAWKAAFLENYSAVSAWILNQSSIKCHEMKHQLFSLSGIPFRGRVILISGLALKRWKMSFPPVCPC